MIIVLGKNGQVGEALAALLGGQCVLLGQKQVDFSKPETLASALEAYRPSGLINAVAYTQVDKAEGEKDLAFTVNGEAPGVLAAWCVKRNIPFVHYSTDYVFDGSGTAPKREEDIPSPLNIYGESKLAGEKAVMAAGGKHLIFRTSWVYNETGSNFVNTMLKLGREREELRVVADQHGAPTYAAHLAAATLKALEAFRHPRQASNGERERGSAFAAAGDPRSALRSGGDDETFPSGLYHLCNAGETTWHGFAEAIFQQARAQGEALLVKRIIPISSAEYSTPAQRPLNSRLSCEKAKAVLGISMPGWQEGLNACMKNTYAN